MKLSKTAYLVYRDCAHNAWVKVHLPEIYKAQPISVFDQALIETGNQVDVLARDLFPGGILIERGDAARTAALVAQHAPVLYQPVFETERYTTACDILVWNGETQSYDLYEVKSSTSGHDKADKDDLYTYDLAFQAHVLRENRVPLGALYVMRLDNEYILDGALDLESLFTRDNFSTRVALIIESVRSEMEVAHRVLQGKVLPMSPCSCIYKGRSNHCTTFAYTNPTVPEYSVHDLARIGASRKKLAALVDAGILAIADIPDNIDLTDKQRNQVIATKTAEPFVDRNAIRDFLAAMQYPIAFLDYETYPCALPRFSGYGPYHQIPFQFSLHVMDEPDGGARHHEFLFTKPGCPDAALVAALKAALPESGTVVVWNQTFEKGINAHLAQRLPSEAAFLHGVNARVVDLMDVFSEQMLVHPAFKGKTSIKFVLPALVPSLSYQALAIQDGGTASETWNKIVNGGLDADEVARERDKLLEYCGLDSLAMVEIWRTLHTATAT